MYEKFEKLLNEKQITPYRVYKDTGISTATLSDWKNGKSQPKKDKIERICAYFNVPLAYFYGNDVPDKKETTLTPKDERDIAKDLNSIMGKLRSGEAGPASFDGADIPIETQELFAQQLDIMLHHLKKINKEKYNPNRNKK